MTSGRWFLRQKWDSLGDSRQFIIRFLGRYHSFFPRTNNFVSIGPNYKFFCVGCRFFQLKQSLNSPSSNSSFDHRQKIVMSAWGIWNIPKCRPTNTDRRPKIDRSSTVFFWGDFDKSDTDYVKHLPSICRKVANRRTRRNVLNLFHQ